MDNATYFQHQMGAPVWLHVRYWVEGSREERTHMVLMVGSANYFAHPDKIESLVLTETGALTTISNYMKNSLEATMFKVVGVSQPKVRER